MKPIFKTILYIIIAILIISCLSSVLGAVLHLSFGIIGSVFKFIWRVIFSPAILIVFVVLIVTRVTNKRSSG